MTLFRYMRAFIITVFRFDRLENVCAINFIFPLIGSCLIHTYDSKHLDRLQKVQYNAAGLIYRSSKFSHVTRLLQTLHLLPIERTVIDFKLASLCFKPQNGSAPTYLSDIFLIALLLGSSALLQTPECSEYHPLAQSQVVSALSLTKLQQHGTSSPLLSVTHPLSVPSNLP